MGNEFVTIETFIDGHFVKLINNDGLICSEEASELSMKAETFSHYTYKKSNTQLMGQYPSALWALASIGHEQHFFFLEKPYGTARPRKYYFRFILLLLKNYFTLLSIFFV